MAALPSSTFTFHRTAPSTRHSLPPRADLRTRTRTITITRIHRSPASSLPPFQQGGLDSLCGLYSIVNADRFINHSSDESAQVLFDSIIHYLSRRRLLAKMLIGGVIHRQMVAILNDVAGERIPNLWIPWRGIPTPELYTFWRSMQNFLDGTPGRAVILGLQGYHDHWTVIETITDKSIFLYDSALIVRLPRYACSTSHANGRRIHHLLPAQTYFLSNDDAAEA
ncbi:MAG TPA: hypothetical protein VMJ64_05720 [Anaerolineales bacterium]|nr:hypothetical protein [Anaerolineales bacterium]